MTGRGIITGATFAAMMAVPALAQDGQQPIAAACRSGGVTYVAGEYACIPVCHGQRRLARCDVSGTSFPQDSHGASSTAGAAWTYVSDACPSAMIINSPWPDDWNEVPVVTNMTPLPLTVTLSAISPEIAPRVGSHWPALIR